MTQTIRTGTLSVTIDGHLGAAQSRDGGWLVCVPPTGAYITSYTGDGAALNLRGSNRDDVQGRHFAGPQRVVPGDALILVRGGSGRGDYPIDAESRSGIIEALPIVFVPYAVGPGLLRPPAIGNDTACRFLRGQAGPIPEEAVRLGHLPSVVDVDALDVDWTKWGAGKPGIQWLTAVFGKFCGETHDGWNTASFTPSRQHPGYGSYLAGAVSQAAVQLCSIASHEAKKPLALAITQWGLDLAGAFSDGRRHDVAGGHCAGRKALVVLAGHLLGIEALANPNAAVRDAFQEDRAYGSGVWWFGKEWDAVWTFNDAAAWSSGQHVAFPPGQWGNVQDAEHDSWAWALHSYLGQVVGAQVGTALAMRLLRREASMGRSYMRFVEQFMQGPPELAQAELQAAGIHVPWGRDYSVCRGAGFCAAAWRRYAPQ